MNVEKRFTYAMSLNHDLMELKQLCITEREGKLLAALGAVAAVLLIKRPHPLLFT